MNFIGEGEISGHESRTP
jgi:hypothetical protein